MPSEQTANRSVSRPPREEKFSSGMVLTAGQRFNPFGVFSGFHIPEVIARYRGLSPLAKMAWGRLYRYAGTDAACFPAIPTLAAEIGVKDRRAQRVLQELEKKGFLERAYRFASGKRKGQISNDYFFLLHPILIESMSVSRSNPGVQSDTPPVSNRTPKERH